MCISCGTAARMCTARAAGVEQQGGQGRVARARIEEKHTFADSTSNPNSAYYNTLSNNNQAAIEDIQEQQMIGPQTKRPHNPDM